MKVVLGILALAVAFIGLSLIISRPKALNPRPQDTDVPPPISQPGSPTEAAVKETYPGTEPFKPPRAGVITTQMTVKGVGNITIEFYPRAAPANVAQFVGLIKKGFYDGILFHRVEPMVIQAGNPATKTAGVDAPEGHDVPAVKFETNDLPHVIGEVGVALTAERSDTGTSQFFINTVRNAEWDGKYCVIGRVTRGFDVVQRITRGDVIEKWVVL